DQNPERLQFMRSRRDIHTSLVMREEKTRFWSFPAVVHPKPIFGRPANLLLDRLVPLQGNGVHRVTGRINARGENHPPARGPLRVNRRRDYRRAGSLCQQTRKWRSRSEPAEKRRPKTVVACVLIA